MAAKKTLLMCLKCGKNFYSSGEYKTHVKECRGSVPKDINKAPKTITEIQAKAGVLVDDARATVSLDFDNGQGASGNLDALNALREEARLLGIKRITELTEKELKDRISGAKIKSPKASK